MHGFDQIVMCVLIIICVEVDDHLTRAILASLVMVLKLAILIYLRKMQKKKSEFQLSENLYTFSLFMFFLNNLILLGFNRKEGFVYDRTHPHNKVFYDGYYAKQLIKMSVIMFIVYCFYSIYFHCVPELKMYIKCQRDTDSEAVE